MLCNRTGMPSAIVGHLLPPLPAVRLCADDLYQAIFALSMQKARSNMASLEVPGSAGVVSTSVCAKAFLPGGRHTHR